jgi:endonuclease G, mitochondrial
MDTLSKIYTQATERLASKHQLLDETYRHVLEQKVRYLDSERIPKRVERLLQNPLMEKLFSERGVADELRQATSLDQLSPAAQSELERVIGGTDFMPAWFLSRGAELRRTSARVRARTASGRDLKGTGFLVGPRLLLTNFHVLDWSDIGQESLTHILPHSLLEFDYEEQFNGIMQPVATFRLEPTTLLLASPWDQLDYVLVAVQQRSNEGAVSIDSFGYNRLAGDLGKIARGEPVFIIQHPNGQPKQVVLQNNRLIDRDEDLPYLTYEADTDRGSSGAPVFNRQWEVVALHHSAEIARDGDGQILAKDGSLWQAEMGSAQIRYLSLNEGVRVSRILANLAAKLGILRKNGLNAIGDPERCSPEGVELLDVTLHTHLGVAPTDLIAPIPIERHVTISSVSVARSSGSFSRPE